MSQDTPFYILLIIPKANAKIIDTITAIKVLSRWYCGIKYATSINNTKFIEKLKSPNVRTFNGKAIIFSNGFTKTFNKANTKAINIAYSNPSTLTPGR